MPKLFQFEPIKYMAKEDPPKSFAVSETSKAGVSAYYLITSWFVPGPLGNAAPSGYAFEVSISKEMFDAMKASGQFGLVEFVQKPDSPCQQFQGDWDAAQFKIRQAQAKLAAYPVGSTQWQQIYFSEVSPLMMQAFQIEMAAGAAGCAINKQGK